MNTSNNKIKIVTREQVEKTTGVHMQTHEEWEENFKKQTRADLVIGLALLIPILFLFIELTLRVFM